MYVAEDGYHNACWHTHDIRSPLYTIKYEMKRREYGERVGRNVSEDTKESVQRVGARLLYEMVR